MFKYPTLSMLVNWANKNVPFLDYSFKSIQIIEIESLLLRLCS